MTARDILQRHGYEPCVPWADGMISTHEIVEVLGVQTNQAGKVFAGLRASGDFDLMKARHPKTGHVVSVLVEKPVAAKAKAKK